MKAWHFLPADKKLKYGDGRKAVKGRKLKCDPEKLSLCNYGLHASVKALDALSFVDWTDAVVCRVELGGKIIEGNNKCVASERTVIAWCKADPILHKFACRIAEDVLPIFESKYPEDPRPRKAIEAKRAWLRGEITDEELKVAEAAAWAAWAAAAEVAACTAAGTAALAASAWATARAEEVAAWAAAAAAEVAAGAAGTEKEKYNTWLEEMFMEAIDKGE